MTETSRNNGSARFTGFTMLSPWLIGLLLVHLLPLACLFYFSFVRWDGLSASPVQWVGGENWSALRNDATVAKTVRHSLIFAAMNVPVQLVVGLCLALLVHHSRRRGLWATLFYSPHALSGVASILIWWWLLNPHAGPINRICDSSISLVNQVRDWIGLLPLNWRAPLWLFSPGWAKPSLVLMNSWHAGGTMLIFLAGLSGVRRELHEAAAIDGTDTFGRFRHITLPHLSPMILLNALSGMVFSMLAFNQPFMLSNFQQEDSLFFYMYYLYQAAFEQNRIGYASAMSLLLLFMLLALTGLAVWATRRWVHFGREAEAL